VRLDRIDNTIVETLQRDCRIPLQQIAARMGVPKSTVHYRIKRLEQEGIVEGYHARISAIRLGYDYLAIVLVKATYGPKYHEKIGRKLARIPGAWGVYYVLGDTDFIILIRATDREDYMKKLELISSMGGIERSSTQVVAKVVKEDPSVEL
jgi:Lrp/AsnC family leucine-responsive transcriptional regulator